MSKITISMPIYNVEKYVRRSLLSALNQTYEDAEILIVDNKGSDNSMNIVRDIQASHPRGSQIRIIEINYPENIGVGEARNCAIDNARGEYLFLMDSDDIITPDCIQLLYDEIISNPVDFVMGSTIKETDQGIRVDNGESIFSNCNYIGNDLINYNYYTNKVHFHVVWNKLYDIKFLRGNNIRCVPHHLNEDVIFSMRLIRSTNRFRTISKVTFYHLLRDDSVMGCKNKEFSVRNVKEHIEIVNLEYDRFEEIVNKNYSKCFLKAVLIRVLYTISNSARSSNVSQQDAIVFIKQLCEKRWLFVSKLNFSPYAILLFLLSLSPRFSIFAIKALYKR